MVRLIVYVYQIKLFVECQFQTVGDLYLVVPFVPVDFYDLGVGIVLRYILSDLGGDEFRGNDRVFAVDLFPLAIFPELYLRAVGEYHFVAGLQEFPLDFGQSHFFVGEIALDELLGLGGQGLRQWVCRCRRKRW